VLLVWGEDDPTFPIARARAMAGQFRDCRGLVAVPRARLLLHEERPEAVAAAALPFLLDERSAPGTLFEASTQRFEERPRFVRV
jgi:pimeloyl-ACP methyl ester carboxylesterase